MRPSRLPALPVLLAALLAAPARAGLLGPVYLDAGYQHQLERDADLEGQGFSVGASVDLGRHFFAGAGYSSIRTEPFTTAEDVRGRLEYRSVNGSLGGFLPLAERAGLSAAGGYSYSQTHALDGFGDVLIGRAEGATGSLGLHFGLVRWVDLSLGGGYSFVGGERSADGSAGLSLHAWRDVWIDSAYWMAPGAEGWTAGLRVRLGN